MSEWAPWMEHKRQCQLFRDMVFEQFCKQSREKDELERKVEREQQQQKQQQIENGSKEESRETGGKMERRT